MKAKKGLKESRDFWMQVAKIQAETMRIMADYLAEMNKSKSYKASDEVIEEKKEPNITFFSLPKSIIELGGIKFHNYYIEQ